MTRTGPWLVPSGLPSARAFAGTAQPVGRVRSVSGRAGYGGLSVVADADGAVVGVRRDRDLEVRVFELVLPGRPR